MLNGVVYVAGLVMGRGWRSLLPRRDGLFDALRMLRYYLGAPFAKFAHGEWLHPRFNTKYNALQRAASFSVPIAGVLSDAESPSRSSMNRLVPLSRPIFTSPPGCKTGLPAK